jgi:hypothetical protein
MLTRGPRHLQPPPPLPPPSPPPPGLATSLLMSRLAAYTKAGGLSSGLAGADVHVLPSSSELGTSAGAMGAPTSAPTAATLASLKALELHSSLEGGVANGAYTPSLAALGTTGLGTTATATPHLSTEDFVVALSPPPMVLVKEIVTTTTTVYPAGSRYPSSRTVTHSTDDPYGRFSPSDSSNF